MRCVCVIARHIYIYDKVISRIGRNHNFILWAKKLCDIKWQNNWMGLRKMDHFCFYEWVAFSARNKWYWIKVIERLSLIFFFSCSLWPSNLDITLILVLFWSQREALMIGVIVIFKIWYMLAILGETIYLSFSTCGVHMICMCNKSHVQSFLAELFPLRPANFAK